MKCPICGSETRIIHHPTIGVFYGCHDCDFIFKSKLDILSEEEELLRYNQHNNSIDDPRYVSYFYRFLDHAVFRYVKGNKGIDFGSGPSPVLAQILERNHGFEMDIYDLFYSPEKVYIGKKYDLVTSTEVVEHLENPLQYFRLFKDLLKPEGVLAVMTLFHHNNDDHFLKWHYIRDLTHISFYTPKTMRCIAAKVGLKLIYTNDIRFASFVIDHE